MKLMTAITCGALLFAGCQKVEDTRPNPVSTEVALETTGGERRTYRRLMINEPEFPGAPTVYFCAGEGGNCLPDVIVTRAHAPAITGVLAVVKSGVQADIVITFTTNRTVLLNYVDKEDIDNVIATTLKATTGEGAHGEQFLLFSDTQDNVTAAYPLFIEE